MCCCRSEKGKRELWEGFSRETERTLSTHTQHVLTHLHSAHLHMKGRDGKSFQLSVGVFVR